MGGKGFAIYERTWPCCAGFPAAVMVMDNIVASVPQGTLQQYMTEKCHDHRGSSHASAPADSPL